ncbi:beta-ketoacyl-[acyl-carrier-protein] synthase II [bacterium CPR1]|nr:beta-ketoacyl-[acyl-carrier-protein] synthase II [bacterium CPR1]
MSTHNQKTRVVVTGLGCVTPLGLGHQDFWSGLLEGRSGVSAITFFDTTAYTTKFAAQVNDFNPEDFINKREAKRMDRVIQFSVAASRMALEDAALSITEENADQVGASIGSGIGGMHTFETWHRTLVEQGPNKVTPLFIPMMIPNMVSGQVSIQFGLKGPNFAVVSACATGGNCIACAIDVIRTGRARVMLAGGTEAAVTPLSVAGFCSMRALSTRNDDPQHASRPFDRERDGFVMGEGAGILVLEDYEHARARGARIYAEIGGYGATADAYHITNPDPNGDGAARAMKSALEDAGLRPEQVDYINAHGTSTPVGDPCETRAIKKLFGDHAYKVAISSSKSMIGHTLGAAGALETVVCVLAVHTDRIPPTINYVHPDPECDLDYVPNVAREAPVQVALNNTFGFGGHNAVIVVNKFNNIDG